MAGKFEVYKGLDGYYRWVLRAGDNAVLATSGPRERYKLEEDAVAAIRSVKDHAPAAEVAGLKKPPPDYHQIAVDNQKRLKAMSDKLKVRLLKD